MYQLMDREKMLKRFYCFKSEFSVRRERLLITFTFTKYILVDFERICHELRESRRAGTLDVLNYCWNAIQLHVGTELIFNKVYGLSESTIHQVTK